MNKLSGFSFSNYRSFLKTTGGVTIDCRPITLFYGRNHAGKSALLRGLGLIVHSLSDAQSQRPKAENLLDFDFPTLGGASFEDLMSRGLGVAGQPVEFSLTFTNGLENENLFLKWTIRRMNDNARLIVEHFEARAEEDEITAEYAPDEQGNDEYSFRYSGSNNPQLIKLAFDKLLPCLHGGSINEKWRRRFAALKTPDISWISSIRARVPRTFTLTRSKNTIGFDGSGCEQVLAHSIENSTSSPLINEISDWLSSHVGVRIEVRRNGNHRELACYSIADPLSWVNVADAGQGVQELLPLLTTLFQKQNNSNILLIEEPESHLHSNLHPALGELFASHVTKNENSMLLVETHSENLLLNLQLQIAQGSLPAESLVVYWVQWSPEGFSEVKQITFDNLGQPQGKWPPGVFSEDIEQARRLLQIQKEKTSKK